MRPERHGFNPCVGKIPWREEMATHSIFLPEELHGQKKKKKNCMDRGTWQATIQSMGLDWTKHAGTLLYYARGF